jgi:hypothetical protein
MSARDVNARDARGRTPLFRAAESGESAEIVRALLLCGAHVDAADAAGATPLHAAGNDRVSAIVFSDGTASLRQDEGGAKLLHGFAAAPRDYQFRGAAGYVSGMGPIAIGAIAGVVCCYAVKLKSRAGYDDALDVVGVHLVGGLVGSLLIGFFANPAFFGLTDDGSLKFGEGIFYGGGASLLLEQAFANGAAIVWSFGLTLVIMLVLKVTIGVRVTPEEETTGLDLALHAETAYHSGALG